MERNHSGRRSIVLFVRLSIGAARLKLLLCCVTAGTHRCIVNHLIDFSVTRKAQHHLIQNIFEHKVLIVIGGRQLHIFEYQLVNNQIRIEYGRLQAVPVFIVLKARDNV